MIYLKTPDEIEKMRKACQLASLTLGQVARLIEPGVPTHRLDTAAREFIVANGGRPACLGYGGFPGTICVEVNETVVHGFPSNYTLREGDIVGIDLVAELDGYNGDMCFTFPVGDVDPEVMKLLTTTKESLYRGIEACKEGHRLGDVCNAVQTYCEKRGYTVVREMCGHGIGRRMHESPEVPNYGRRGIGARLQDGMCICIEPMINMGSRNIVIDRNGWDCRTRDGKPSAHYEHTLAFTGGRREVLTTFDYIPQEIKDKFK